MESILIYRGLKRDTLFLMVPNLDLRFSPKGSQLLVQNVHHELSNVTVEGCLS